MSDAFKHTYTTAFEFHRVNGRFRHHSNATDLENIYVTHGAKITGVNSIKLVCYPEERLTLEQAKQAYANGDRTKEIRDRCEVFQDENGINMKYVSGFPMELSDYDLYLFRFGRDKFITKSEHMVWNNFEEKVVKNYVDDREKYHEYMRSLVWQPPSEDNPTVLVDVPAEIWHWFLPFLLNIDRDAAVIDTTTMPNTITEFNASEGFGDIVIPGATGFTIRCAEYLFEYMRCTPSAFVTCDTIDAYNAMTARKSAKHEGVKQAAETESENAKSKRVKQHGAVDNDNNTDERNKLTKKDKKKYEKDYSVYVPPPVEEDIYEITPHNPPNYTGVDRTRSYQMIRRWIEDNRNHIGVSRMCNFMLLHSIELEIYYCVVQEWGYFPSMAYNIYLTGVRPETYPTIVRGRDAKAWRIAHDMETPLLDGDKDKNGVPWLEEYIVDMPEDQYIIQNGFLSNRMSVIWTWYQNCLDKKIHLPDNANLKYEEPTAEMVYKYVPRWD